MAKSIPQSSTVVYHPEQDAPGPVTLEDRSKRERYRQYAELFSERIPRNEGSVSDFVEFVNFCVENGKKRRTLNDLVGGGLENPIRPMVIIKASYKDKPENS